MLAMFMLDVYLFMLSFCINLDDCGKGGWKKDAKILKWCKEFEKDAKTLNWCQIFENDAKLSIKMQKFQ